jgi:hypothetical protein
LTASASGDKRIANGLFYGQGCAFRAQSSTGRQFASNRDLTRTPAHPLLIALLC